MVKEGGIVPPGARPQPFPTPVQMLIIDPLLIEHIKIAESHIHTLRCQLKDSRRQLTICRKSEKHWEKSYKDDLSMNSSLGDMNDELQKENMALEKKNKKLSIRNNELEASKILLDRLTEIIGREKIIAMARKAPKKEGE